MSKLKAGKRKKVLVVDDSAFMRKVITDMLNSHPELEVIGVARNGKDALDKLTTLHPDVITLDVEMPIMDGIEALKKIMEIRPTPVVMLSSTTEKGAENTVLAMSSGAIDFVAKPGGAISLNLDLVKEEIIEKVLNASKVAMNKVNPRQNFSKEQQKDRFISSTLEKNQDRESKETSVQPGKSVSQRTRSKFKTSHQTILAIGTSTGGPRALQEVLINLPKDIAAPILVVQHMPAGFTKSLANRLNRLSKITVKEAEDGDLLENGVAYIAPGGKHLKARRLGTSLFAQLDDYESPRSGHRPSVDILFESIASLSHVKCLAVIMTGMGNDGMAGTERLKESCETIVIAESKETSVVYGMPKAIVDHKLADEVTRLENIASTINEIM